MLGLTQICEARKSECLSGTLCMGLISFYFVKIMHIDDNDYFHFVTEPTVAFEKIILICEVAGNLPL